MSRVAVLICVRAGNSLDLLRRAIQSTAASMRDGDAFFLHVDGAAGLPHFNGAEIASPASWTTCFSTNRVGLAAGLNRLIDLAMSQDEFDYLARMDDDDESLPERIKAQMEYLDYHPAVDVVGSLCREIDERGNFIQMKSLPADHQAIVRMLPKRNPLNHPTVMFRSSLFEHGIRYREDVRLMEDYFLWIDLAAMGCRFANISIPLLNFQRDAKFLLRRSGWGQACSEFKVRLHAIMKLRLYEPINFVWAASAFFLRLTPSVLQAQLYSILR